MLMLNLPLLKSYIFIKGNYNQISQCMKNERKERKGKIRARQKKLQGTIEAI